MQYNSWIDDLYTAMVINDDLSFEFHRPIARDAESEKHIGVPCKWSSKEELYGDPGASQLLSFLCEPDNFLKPENYMGYMVTLKV